MLAVAALLVGTSVPANALFDPELPPAAVALSSVPVDALEVVELKDQVIETEAADVLTATAAVRDDWSVTSYAEMLRIRYGSNNYSYSSSGVGAIRWPFAFTAPITSGFGSRVAPCRGCPTNHRGLDFAPGYGTAIGSVADGVVSAVGWSNAYGYRVEIEHVINGQRITSLYAHMIDSSSMVQVGSAIVAGDVVGAVGSTGLSTGPHLHLEIRIDGVHIDPFPWLTANAG
jgi:murein DD-endopeptidase MepM/ murein hydrolase activator NlpD